jgi:hypothetical protein
VFLYTGSNAASKSPEFETSLDAKAEEDLLPFAVVVVDVLLSGDDDNLSVVVFFLVVLKRAKLFPEEDAELPLW